MSRENVIEYIPKRETYLRHGILSSNGGWGGIKDDIVSISTIGYWLCKLRFWRFRANPYYGFLVEINRWTRPYHFSQDWDSERDSFKDAKNTLSFIAIGGKRKDGKTSMIPVFLLVLVWLPGFIITFHDTTANFLDVSTVILLITNILWFIWRGINKMMESI